MKKLLSNKNKIIPIVLILIMITGIIILCTIGFEKSISYKNSTRIEVYIPKGYEKKDIINIANETFANKEFVFEEIEKLNQVACIRIADYTDEELNNYKGKISEKYDIDKDSLELHEVSIPETRIRNIVKPYVFPVLIVTILSLIYIGIRNIKSSKSIQIILKTILSLSAVLGIYFSLILIFRIPFGEYIMPIALALYIITMLLLSCKNTKE